MTVKRIVANIATQSIPERRRFYEELLGLKAVMDHGWIVTLASDERALVQIAFASEGGSGTPVPDLSIEVDDLDEVLARAEAMNLTLAYGPADEPWGVRRFFVRDPDGLLLNILVHANAT